MATRRPRFPTGQGHRFSKAYIYKFFESKQAIGEMICSSCLQQIQTEVNAAIHEVDSPPEKLRRMLKVLMEACLRLFFQDRKLYEIAASAASGRWPATLLYEGFIEQTLREIPAGPAERRLRAQDASG